MGINIEQSYVNVYQDQMEMLSQQQLSLLDGSVSSADYQGEAIAPILQLGADTPQEQNQRAERITFNDPSLVRRWVKPGKLKYSAIPIETQDQVKMLSQLQGGYAEVQANGFGVDRDRALITAAFGTAIIGKDATGTEAYDTGMTVGVTVGGGGSNTGLNYDKFIEADRLIKSRKVIMNPGDFKVAVIGSKENAQMAKQAEAIQKNYNISAQFDALGNLTAFAGWKIIISEELPVASSIRSCLFYVRSGMHLGYFQRINKNRRVYQDTTLAGLPWVVYADQIVGATRTNKDKVMKVNCSEV